MLQNEPTFWTSEAGKSHTANRNNCKLKNNSPPRHFHSQQNRKRRRCETLLPSCRQPNWKCSEPPFMGDTLTTSISLSLSKHLFFLTLNCTDVCGITRSETNAFSLSLSLHCGATDQGCLYPRAGYEWSKAEGPWSLMM